MDLLLQITKFISIINIEYGVLSVAIYLIVYVLCAICFIPCSPMTLLAGLLWGGYGLVYALVATTLASFATFSLSRYLLHDFFYDKFKNNKYYTWLNCNLEKSDWKIILATQTNPIVPSSTFGYLYGLSTINVTKYVLLSFLFSIPLNVCFVFFGHGAIEFLQNGKILYVILALALFLIYKFIVKSNLVKKIEIS